MTGGLLPGAGMPFDCLERCEHKVSCVMHGCLFAHCLSPREADLNLTARLQYAAMQGAALASVPARPAMMSRQVRRRLQRKGR